MLKPDKVHLKAIDPSAAGKGTAGVLPRIPDVDRALVSLDDTVWAEMAHEHHHGHDRDHGVAHRAPVERGSCSREGGRHRHPGEGTGCA